MVWGVIILTLSIIAIVSSTDFISKSLSNITQNFGISEYLSSTIILSFVISLPVFLLMIFSDFLDITGFGINLLIGFSIAIITIVMGVFLLKNEILVEKEEYRNISFMWASSILFFAVLINNLVDRMDAIFLLSLFFFYCLFVYYKTKKAKKYTFLKIKKSNIFLFIPAIAAILFSSIIIVFITKNYYIGFISPNILSLTILSLIFTIPVFDLIKNNFKRPELTFNNLIGTIVVTLTLIPGIIAIIRPIPFFVGTVEFFTLIYLNICCLAFTIITRFKKIIKKETGIFLIGLYILFLILVKFI